MRLLRSALLQFLFFGAFTELMVAAGGHSAAAALLFVIGELGGTSALCTFIVRQYRKSVLPGWLMEALVGYIASHLCILTLLHESSWASIASHARGPSDFAWVVLNLQIGLLVVLSSTTVVLCKPRIRKFTEAHFRKFTAAA